MYRNKRSTVVVGCVVAVLLFAGVPVSVFAGSETTTYHVPDVKDEYCGVHIDFHYCKCAFHNQYCDRVGQHKDGAHAYVFASFLEWNRERIQRMGEQCIAVDGHWDTGKWSCTVCTDGDVLQGSRCVAPHKTEERCELPRDFERRWEVYSDFDDAIPVAAASYEVGQYHKALDELAALIAEAQALEYDMEIDRQTRLELREYKHALVHNIRSNITKAIFRLAWVTYNTVQGGKGNAGSYQTLLEPQHAVEGFGAAMKLVQAHIPAGEKELQFDTSNTEGNVKSIAWNATLETLESVGSPTAVAQQAAKDIKGAIVGGPDLTEAEVAILRQQHLDNQAVDTALAESYAVNATRRAQLLQLEKRIAELHNELQVWKAKEYARVRTSLLEDCHE